MAGFDPARFWDLTPRLFALEMQGAADRMQHERAMIWSGAMLPYLKKTPSFEEFTGYKPDHSEQIKRWVSAWDRIDLALGRNG